MIKYLCKNCNLESETSVCPVCNSRADLEQTEVFFCANCNAPSFEKKCNCCGSNCDYIGTDLRPVFPEERLLIEVLIHEPFKFAGKSIWNVGGSKYIVDGKKLNLSYKELREKNDCKDVIEELKKYTCDNQQYVDSYMQSNGVVNFIKINRPRLNSITYEAIEYINEVGFLPLFKNDIPGFSLEERTVPEYWWSEDSEHDPWEWREIIARRGDVAYGKFFDKKAGFISKEWMPYFVNYRRRS